MVITFLRGQIGRSYLLAYYSTSLNLWWFKDYVQSTPPTLWDTYWGYDIFLPLVCMSPIKYYSCQLIHRKNKENLQNLSKRDRYTRTYTSLYINYHVNIHRDWQHETKEKAHTHMERCDSHTKRGSGQVAIFGMLCTKPRRGRRHGCLASVAPVNYFLHLWVRYLD
jgi:hypothetical protein